MSNNTASQSGGAVSCQQGEIVLGEGMLRDNTATGNGGALSVDQCDLTIDNIKFLDNRALQGGGGLFSKSSSTNIHNSKGTLNTAGSIGGFMVITKHSNLISHYMEIEGNIAEVTGNDISIANSSVAEMKHTNISALLRKEHCLFTVTGGSKLIIASMYSMNYSGTTNINTMKGSNMVCIDRRSQVSGLETGALTLSGLCLMCSAWNLLFTMPQ